MNEKDARSRRQTLSAWVMLMRLHYLYDFPKDLEMVYPQQSHGPRAPALSPLPVLRDSCQLESSASLQGSLTWIFYCNTLILQVLSSCFYSELSIFSFKCWTCQRSLLFPISWIEHFNICKQCAKNTQTLNCSWTSWSPISGQDELSWKICVSTEKDFVWLLDCGKFWWG